MLIKIQQFLYGKNHSWSIVGQNIGRSLIKLGHDVHFVSTDGIEEKFIPEDLKSYVKKNILPKFDMQLSYTAPHNWPIYLKNGDKNRFAIWNYEYKGAGILKGFAKYAKFTDYVLPSSNFSKEVFLDMGIPEEKMIVIPHGFNIDDYKNTNKYPLKTNKKYKILLNIAQPHKRKAIHLALKTFGEAFDKNDDVCLVAKIFTSNKTDHQFNVDFYKLLKNFKHKYPNHAEIEVVTDFIPNIVELYNACDINFSATHTECWHLPSLESLATGLINIVPRYGGILHFCNNQNSLLIDGKIVRAPRDHQYWNTSPYASHFEIDINSAVSHLRNAYENYETIKTKLLPNMKATAEKYTWDNVAQDILKLCK